MKESVSNLLLQMPFQSRVKDETNEPLLELHLACLSFVIQISCWRGKERFLSAFVDLVASFGFEVQRMRP